MAKLEKIIPKTVPIIIDRISSGISLSAQRKDKKV